MGRKIPAKKHRGVKDPEKQRAIRLAGLESCTNKPPRNVDEQAIPKSLERVIQLKQAAKNSDGLRKKRKRKKNSLICVGLQREAVTNSHPKAQPEKVVPVFQQKPGESGHHFWHRVTKDTHAFLKETEFEQKYGVQVERNPETGLIQGLTKHKVVKDDIEKLRAKHKNISKKKATAEGGEKALTKREKRKLKLRLKREKRLREENDDDEFGRLRDKVAFGEVAHEPPRLKFKTKEVTGEERKPKNLLLSSLLEAPRKVAAASKAIDRTGKRKKLPAAERRKLERQRDEMIAAYRQLKAQRSAGKTD